MPLLQKIQNPITETPYLCLPLIINVFMKKIFASIIVICTIFCFASCSTKFNIAAPYKNITVIYGLLDAGDTAHYIRIEKAFLDQNKSALDMAKVWDSSYFAHLNVRIERLFIADTTHIHDTIHLNLVDLDLEGYPKQQGTFFTSPNYAYKFTGLLDSQYVYRIVVSNFATGEVDSATTHIINDDPGSFLIPLFDNVRTADAGMDFNSTLPNSRYSLNYAYVLGYNQTYSPVAIAQAIIRFNWVDSNIVTHSITRNYFDDNFGYLSYATSTSFQKKNIDLYYDLSNGMGTAPANVIRLIDRCDFYLYLGTPEFNTYINNSLVQGTGLTGTEIEPVYTNIAGANVLGLFTAKANRTGKVTISNATVDSLIASPIMANTLLKGTAY